ncbi:MAG: hypothetical protein HON32_09250 [Francisellaceae bacterium]|jgi:hypothetical protein|nr:hypothetical protein [Francisellaceae bacterium]MBT6539420.1 hypothetical protein [Francisellaceae bacterium]
MPNVADVNVGAELTKILSDSGHALESLQTSLNKTLYAYSYSASGNGLEYAASWVSQTAKSGWSSIGHRRTRHADLSKLIAEIKDVSSDEMKDLISNFIAIGNWTSTSANPTLLAYWIMDYNSIKDSPLDGDVSILVTNIISAHSVEIITPLFTRQIVKLEKDGDDVVSVTLAEVDSSWLELNDHDSLNVNGAGDTPKGKLEDVRVGHDLMLTAELNVVEEQRPVVLEVEEQGGLTELTVELGVAEEHRAAGSVNPMVRDIDDDVGASTMTYSASRGAGLFAPSIYGRSFGCSSLMMRPLTPAYYRLLLESTAVTNRDDIPVPIHIHRQKPMGEPEQHDLEEQTSVANNHGVINYFQEMLRKPLEVGGGDGGSSKGNKREKKNSF